jgi:hypothetical protein
LCSRSAPYASRRARLISSRLRSRQSCVAAPLKGSPRSCRGVSLRRLHKATLKPLLRLARDFSLVTRRTHGEGIATELPLAVLLQDRSTTGRGYDELPAKSPEADGSTSPACGPWRSGYEQLPPEGSQTSLPPVKFLLDCLLVELAGSTWLPHLKLGKPRSAGGKPALRLAPPSSSPQSRECRAVVVRAREQSQVRKEQRHILERRLLVFLEPETEPAGGEAAEAVRLLPRTRAVSSSASATITRPIRR